MQVPDESWRNRIECDIRKRGGQPVIRGTRIPVSVIVANLAEMSAEDLRGHYPQLSSEDIKAALLYAAQASQNDLVA